MKEIKVAAVFSDYCEEASNLAASCITSVTGAPPKIQVRIFLFLFDCCSRQLSYNTSLFIYADTDKPIQAASSRRRKCSVSPLLL